MERLWSRSLKKFRLENIVIKKLQKLKKKGQYIIINDSMNSLNLVDRWLKIVLLNKLDPLILTTPIIPYLECVNFMKNVHFLTNYTFFCTFKLFLFMLVLVYLYDEAYLYVHKWLQIFSSIFSGFLFRIIFYRLDLGVREYFFQIIIFFFC